MRLYVLVLLLLTPCLAWSATDPGTPLAFTTIAKGSYSGAIKAQRKVIQTDKGWQQCWQQLQSVFVPVPPCPTINFSKDTVVLVSLGEQSGGGHDIEIEQVLLDYKTIAVVVDVRHPGPGCLTTQALTQPYHVVTVPRKFKSAQFTEKVFTKPCGERH